MRRSRTNVASSAKARTKTRALTVVGVMSGTSADGIDVALVRIGLAPGARSIGAPKDALRLLAHVAVPYPPAVRRRVLDAMNGENQSVAELSRLHWRLGQLYADAIEIAVTQHPMRIDLIGCHGQTIYHQAAPKRSLGGDVACTWQMGEASVIAARLGVPVVSDFRPADMAAGGQGAPLVPLLDAIVFRHPKRNRVLQNLGGIGNLTVVPAGAARDVLAFDTGPGNMVIDAVMEKCFRRPYDAGGAIAARGRILWPALEEMMANRFFGAPPPKSAGREQFGREFADRFLARCLESSPQKEDAVATATALTAESIALAWTRFVQPVLRQSARTDYIVAGGGARNPMLMRMISDALAPCSEINIAHSDAFGIPTAAKEAMAFALLAWRTWHGLPGNLPSATGAQRPVVLGKITYA